MVTLTYPVDPDPNECRDHLRAWLKRLQRQHEGEFDFGWCIEAHKSGRPHFHVFFGSGGTLGDAISREKTQRIFRKGKAYRVMRGEFEALAVRAWLDILDKNNLMGDRDETERFQWGGICERLNSPDAAARYVSKEASKRTQKDCQLGKGCFWRLARHLRGKPRWMSSISKEGRDVMPSFSRLFDKRSAVILADCKEFAEFEGETEKDVEAMLKAQRLDREQRLKHATSNRWTTDWIPED